MSVSRGFLVISTLYLIVGIAFGIHMGASGDHSMSPVHAHINLLGFTLMAVFGLVYHVFPSMSEGALARVHFWLHQVGTLVLVVMLFLLFSATIGEESMAPIAPISELLIFAGVLVFAWNVFRNAR